jgi:hypothetical protein
LIDLGEPSRKKPKGIDAMFIIVFGPDTALKPGEAPSVHNQRFCV